MIKLIESLKTLSARLIARRSKSLGLALAELKLFKESSTMAMLLQYRIISTNYHQLHIFRISV